MSDREQAVTILRGVDSPPPLMVHLEAEPTGCNMALCGATLLGIDCEDQDLDCVVCAEIAEAMGYE